MGFSQRRAAGLPAEIEPAIVRAGAAAHRVALRRSGTPGRGGLHRRVLRARKPPGRAALHRPGRTEKGVQGLGGGKPVGVLQPLPTAQRALQRRAGRVGGDGQEGRARGGAPGRARQRITATQRGAPADRRAIEARQADGRSDAAANTAPRRKGSGVMELYFETDGVVRALYGEELNLLTLGRVEIRRASFVEPDEVGRWWADLSPVSGPRLGPFSNRSQALTAEADW